MAVVIADAGPLIAFAKLERLDLLPALFGEVLTTHSVLDECLKGPGHDAVLIQKAFQLWPRTEKRICGSNSANCVLTRVLNAFAGFNT